MHADDWRRLSIEELRYRLFAQEAIIRCALVALERLGVRFTTNEDDDEETGR
jgi:hypothetical protein